MVGKRDKGDIRDKGDKGKQPLVCIVGGSSGSHAINEFVEGCLEKLVNKYQVIHQTGDAQEFKDYDRLMKLKESLPKEKQQRYILRKFIKPEEIGNVFHQADLIVSRCGMNTITSLLVLQKPSLLIPLPFAQRNEQYKNALLLKDAGLGIVLDQKTLTSEELFENIVKMIENKKNYHVKSSVPVLNPQEAAEKIIEMVKSVTKTP